MSRLKQAIKKKDVEIRAILDINDQVQTNNELAVKLYSKADDERSRSKEELQQLK
jgi:hypothetical protein